MFITILVLMLLQTGLLVLVALACGRLLLNQEFERQRREVLDTAHENTLLMISDSLQELSQAVGATEVNLSTVFERVFPENEGAESKPAQS